MKDKTFILFLFSIICISCTTGAKSEESNLYDDIDLFNLEGTEKIKTSVNYPYIKVENQDSFKKRIVYVISAKDSIEKIYRKNAEYWTTSYESNSDTGVIRTYEYIGQGKIIELDYYGTYDKKDYHLHDASVIQQDSMITYGFGGEKGIAINPDVKNFEIARKTGTSIFIDKIYVEKDKLIKIWSRLDKADGIDFFSDTNCYEANNRSWFWWRYFKGKKIECK